MKGQILFGKKPLEKAFIRIYADSTKLLQKIESDAEGWVAFQLELQKNYTIKVSKPGYVTKIITVDSRMPDSQLAGDYYFEFGMDLFEDIEGLDVSMLRDPIAKVFFNTFTKKFDYDYNYTALINSKLEKLYKNYKSLKKKSNTPVVSKQLTPDTETVQMQQPITVVSSGSRIVFSVEVVSSSEQVPRNSPRFKGIINVKEYQEGEGYKYYVGEYPAKADAEKMKDRISGYFPDASIAAFKDGKKITLEEALQPQEK